MSLGKYLCYKQNIIGSNSTESKTYIFFSEENVPKSDNAIIAEQFENAVFNKNLNFDGVKETLDIINLLFPNILTEENIGRNYKTSNGDLLINNKIVELKYITTGGNGTYLNTSMYNLTKYGCLSYAPFQEKYGIFVLWENEMNMNVRDRLSPINVSESSAFYKTNKKFCDKLSRIDELARKEYVSYLYEYFSQNREKAYAFFNDCLTKEIANKQPADVIIIYNSKQKKCSYILKEQILNRDLEGFKISSGGLGLVLNSLRINVGWQNHNGVCNPTLRVFLK